MNYGQLIHQYEQELVAIGEEKEALVYIFKELKAWSQTDLVLHLARPVSAEDDALLSKIMTALREHRPAQYVTGTAYFADLVLTVDERVLIPRPETEELVTLLLAENASSSLKVLDIGTGSGAIALALAKERPDWEVWASDISQAALALAQENAAKHQLAVRFCQSDVFSNLSGKFDIIISNPPYISRQDQHEVGKNVLSHEPHLALFADNDGLAIYQKIAQGASAHLQHQGKIYLEIGHKQGFAVTQLFQNYFPQHRLRVLTDSFGRDRMVVMDNG